MELSKNIVFCARIDGSLLCTDNITDNRKRKELELVFDNLEPLNRGQNRHTFIINYDAVDAIPYFTEDDLDAIFKCKLESYYDRDEDELSLFIVKAKNYKLDITILLEGIKNLIRADDYHHCQQFFELLLTLMSNWYIALENNHRKIESSEDLDLFLVISQSFLQYFQTTEIEALHGLRDILENIIYNQDKPLLQKKMDNWHKKAFIDEIIDKDERNEKIKLTVNEKKMFLDCLKEGVELGDDVAIHYLGKNSALKNHPLISFDPKTVQKCYDRLIDDPDNTYIDKHALEYGKFYYTGVLTNGIPEFSKAYILLTLAAHSGNPEAQLLLSELFLTGNCAIKSYEVAENLLESAVSKSFDQFLNYSFDNVFPEAVYRKTELSLEEKNFLVSEELLAQYESNFNNLLLANLAADLRQTQTSSDKNRNGETSLIKNKIISKIKEILPKTVFSQMKRSASFATGDLSLMLNVYYDKCSFFICTLEKSKVGYKCSIKKADERNLSVYMDDLEEINLPERIEDIQTVPFVYLISDCWECNLTDEIFLTLSDVSKFNIYEGDGTPKNLKRAFIFNNISGNSFVCVNKVVAEIEGTWTYNQTVLPTLLKDLERADKKTIKRKKTKTAIKADC
ncbi:MAG: hypothetical protein ACI4NE_09185 [Succinivibrio sp.]